MLLAGACGGDGVLLDTGTRVPEGPTLSSLQTSIFTPRCAIDGCHAGSEPQQGMDLSAGKAYAHLVRVASTELPAFQRVTPKVSAGHVEVDLATARGVTARAWEGAYDLDRSDGVSRFAQWGAGVDWTAIPGLQLRLFYRSRGGPAAVPGSGDAEVLAEVHVYF
jgi:hypothetical protein